MRNFLTVSNNLKNSKYMKSYILLFIGLLLSMYCFSKPIDTKTATTVALNYIKYRQPGKTFTLSEVISEGNANETFYYIVTFKEGGWVMVSADDAVIPVLGYSFEGTIHKSSLKPDAFIAWTENYKTQISTAKSLKSVSIEISDQWDRVINNRFVQLKSYSYTQGTWLLNTPRGQISWGQEENNSGTCTPSYNSKAPGKNDNNIGCFGSADDCDCDHKPVGCAAVAMAQIMWYWQFPQSSSFRSYNWDMMPSEILYTTPQAHADAIAQLLRDCGDATNTTFCCNGSWTTTNNIEDALKNNFKYKGVEKKTRTDWSGAMWRQMLRAEIDAGRPVLYRGDECDLCAAKHFFVVDGYRMSPEEFHINWGWTGSFNGFYTIDDLTPGSSNFNKNNQAIIGFSPTCNQVPLDITDLSYTSVNSGVTKHEQAKNNTTIPTSGKTLTVNSGGKLIFTAGNRIKLTPGFSAKNGSEFHTNLITMGFGESGISVPTWYNAFTPNGDGVNDQLCLDVYNADTWECEAYDRWGIRRYYGAGSVRNNEACVWDGSGADYMDAYACIIKFRNSCGEVLDHAYMVTVIDNTLHTKSASTELTLKENELLKTEISEENIISFEIYPNPTSGIFTIQLSSEEINNHVEIFDISGKVVYTSNFKGTNMQVDLNMNQKGAYFVRVYNEKDSFIKKLIIE